jgi:beta-N-acetylhexosaminidase
MMKYLIIFLSIYFFTSQNIYAQSIDLRNKIGQMIMVGFTGKFIPQSLKEDLQQRNLGGVIYFAQNISSPSQLKLLSDSLYILGNSTALLAIDQEGGLVARLNKSTGYESTYSAYKLGTLINKEDSTRFYARKMAEWMKNADINVDFAPVVDVNVNPLSPAIGKNERSYSKNPDSVYFHTSWFIDELNKKNIITTLKHFPGHGSAMQDSHLGFTDITSTWADSELVPYQRLINQGYKDFIMSGHLYNKNLDSIYPASLSKIIITDLLRKKLAFQGLVITDELFMKAITNNYTFDQAVELAVNAGNDILLFSTNIHNNASLVEEVISIIEKKVNEGKILSSRIDESYSRIIDLKRRHLIINSIVQNSQVVPSKVSITNYPNPFNPDTRIRFSIPASTNSSKTLVQLKIFDIIGREITTLINEPREAGTYEIEFSALKGNINLSSGVYFCLLKAGNYIESRKIFYLK